MNKMLGTLAFQDIGRYCLQKIIFSIDIDLYGTANNIL